MADQIPSTTSPPTSLRSSLVGILDKKREPQSPTCFSATTIPAESCPSLFPVLSASYLTTIIRSLQQNVNTWARAHSPSSPSAMASVTPLSSTAICASLQTLSAPKDKPRFQSMSPTPANHVVMKLLSSTSAMRSAL